MLSEDLKQSKATYIAVIYDFQSETELLTKRVAPIIMPEILQKSSTPNMQVFKDASKYATLPHPDQTSPLLFIAKSIDQFYN